MRRQNRMPLNRIQTAGLYAPQLAEQTRLKAGRAIDEWISGLSMEAYETLTTLDMKRLRACIERAIRENERA